MVKRMSERVTVVLPLDLKEDIDKLKDRLHLDQSSFIRHLLYGAIRDEKIKIALEEYSLGKISFGNASELAGLSLWEFIDEARRRNVRLQFTMQDAEEEIGKIKKRKLDKYIK